MTMLADERIEDIADANGHAAVISYGKPAEREVIWYADNLMPFSRAIESVACADRDARIAELERELEKEKQYVKEITKDRDYWMTVAAERALLLEKNRKVSKPLSDYEFDEIG